MKFSRRLGVFASILTSSGVQTILWATAQLDTPSERTGIMVGMSILTGSLISLITVTGLALLVALTRPTLGLADHAWRVLVLIPLGLYTLHLAYGISGPVGESQRADGGLTETVIPSVVITPTHPSSALLADQIIRWCSTNHKNSCHSKAAVLLCVLFVVHWLCRYCQSNSRPSSCLVVWLNSPLLD